MHQDLQTSKRKLHVGRFFVAEGRRPQIPPKELTPALERVTFSRLDNAGCVPRLSLTRFICSLINRDAFKEFTQEIENTEGENRNWEG